MIESKNILLGVTGMVTGAALAFGIGYSALKEDQNKPRETTEFDQQIVDETCGTPIKVVQDVCERTKNDIEAWQTYQEKQDAKSPFENPLKAVGFAGGVALIGSGGFLIFASSGSTYSVIRRS